MRTTLALVAFLFSTVAIAQSNPPTVGGKPLLQVKPKAAPQPKAAAAKPQSVAAKLQACLEIDGATKERLICYEAMFPPKPNPMAAAADEVSACRFTNEEDELLPCFNGFAAELRQLPRQRREAA